MLELYGKESLFRNQLEMKCADIMTKYCMCQYHVEYPMKHGEGHQFLSFKQYKVLHEANIPVGEIIRQATLHEGYINSTLMRILYEVHGLKTPYSPNILLQEERMARVYPGFSPKEYELLKQSLELLGENKPKDMKSGVVQRIYLSMYLPCGQERWKAMATQATYYSAQ